MTDKNIKCAVLKKKSNPKILVAWGYLPTSPHRASNLLDEALGATAGDSSSIPSKRAEQFCPASSSHQAFSHSFIVSAGAVDFIALAHPFFHYDRVHRKLGCNPSIQRQYNKFILLSDFFLIRNQGVDIRV